VHCDLFKDGIWKFQTATTNTTELLAKEAAFAESSTIVEVQGVKIQRREKGIYEPASLARNKLASTSSFSTSSISSSPSSSLDNTIRNSQAINSRAVQGNSSQSITNEPPIPSPGLKSAIGPPELWPSLKDIHESFISAVLGSIVYFLSHDHGFVPLNSRTLIWTSDTKGDLMQGSNSITLATLDISLTSLGSLVVKAHSDSAPGLQSLSRSLNLTSESPKLRQGAPLWLAPGGNPAKFYASQDEKKLPSTLPNSHLQTNLADHRQHGFNGSTIQSWQSKCLEWLSAKGLNTAALDDGGWIFVQVLNGNSPYFNTEYLGNSMLEDLTIVPWPALLCFQTSSSSPRESQSFSMNLTSRDPLSFAEEWFMSKDERAASLVKRQKDRQAAEAKSREQSDVDARIVQSLAYSPAALRRGSNAGAMYPTPPDAVHHLIGATPSFDGTVSTPGNPNALFAQDVASTPQNSNLGITGPEADIWGSSGKKDRLSSNMNFNENDNDNDNVFGDVAEDIYGIITDADFNFFDGPDAVQGDQREGVTEEGASASQVSIPAELSAVDVTSAPPPDVPDTQMRDQDNDENLGQQEESSKVAETDQQEATQESQMAIISSEEIQKPIVSPPFDMESVFKRVVKDSTPKKRSPELRRTSVFEKVDFKSSVLSVNKKYGANGRFTFSDETRIMSPVGPPSLPKTEYLSRRRKLADREHESRSLARILQTSNNVPEVPADEDEPMVYLMDSDHASQISEQDDTSHTTDELSMIFKPGAKRKWSVDDEGGDDMSSSFNALAVEYTQSIGTPMSISGSQIPLLEGDPADWPLTTYFTSPEPDAPLVVLSDVDCITTAQTLADQAVSGTLKLPDFATSTANDSHSPDLKVSRTRELMHALGKTINICIKEATACTLRSFLDIQGIPVLNQGLRLPPRPIPHPRGGQPLDSTRSNNPFQIPPPQLEVRRADSKLALLPSAVSFWENLGLGPSKGGKDVSAICVYPSLDGIAGNASAFLDQMRSIYESSRLGNHDRLVCKDLPNSLVPFPIDPAQQINQIHHLTTLKETTARLSRILSSLPVEEKNFVVYFVYPVDNAALLVHICTAFQHLFNLYRKALSDRKITTANELVLQLVPLSFIASPTSIAIPRPSEYLRLAMEVYNRCIEFTTYTSAPAIILEQPLPKSIDFKLNATPSASLLQENSCLHIAYAQSIDDRWITAAWTDNRGSQQMTASYCLGRKNEPLSMPFSDVANEIWETTLDVISSKKIHWRIMITRVGVMDPSEIDFWIGLAATEQAVQVNLTLITVQTDPSLRLLPTCIALSPPNSNVTQAVITPVSTPQASQVSIVSPETASTPARDAAGNAPTPADNTVEPEGDARLIDYTDQSWGAILAHRLNNSNSLLELNPALISGYLMKRGGTNSDDPPIVMEVNIVHSEVVGNPRTFHEGLLREILGYYRGLGTLARVRGVVDAVKDVRPWHIAAAEKAVKALYMLM